MMNPEMMRMASEMMSKMTPEQIAAMQRQAASMSPDMMQQAMNMAQNATPEQIAQMRAAASSMPPDVLAAQASAAASSMGARQPQQGCEAAAALKAEGNRLHGARQWRAAADKYEQALQSIEGNVNSQARDLRTSCHSNLASCFLQLGDWRRCVEQCGTVLAADASNRKALYRRGQALCALGRYADAVDDLRQAVKLSPESEKDLIREKLAEAKQKLRQADQGVVIEEVTEPAAADEPAPAPTPAPPAGAQQQQQQQQRQQQEGLTAESDDDDMPPLEDLPQPAGGTAAVPAAPAAAAAAGAGAALPPFMPPGMDASRMQQAQEMLQKNPDMARQAAAAMSAMSDEQIAAMVAQSGMPGVTPEMAKQAAAMMRSMPPEQLSAMAQTQLGAGGMGGGAAPAAAAAAAAPAAPLAGPGMPAMPPGDMAAASEALQKNPEMMKQAASMLENMSEEQLRSMAAAMPGAAGMQIDPAQMKMAAKMMASMSPEDVERMQRMAASMGMAPGGGAATAPAGAGAAVAAEPSAAAAGGMPGFDPATMPPDMMADMRKRMQDPEMLKMMKGMLKGMDPQSLADMMKQSGMNVTPEQAQSMVNSLDKVSDKHLELIARLMGWVNAVIAAWRAVKAWAMSQGALALALLVLLVAVLLRVLGWI